MPAAYVPGPHGPMVVSFASGASYTGPGDIVASATAWWGLRAYSAAKAGTAAVRLQRSSDNSQADISTIANGSLNVADAFFNGSTYIVITLYDQTGNGWHLGDASADPALGPVFTLSGIGALPVMTFTGTKNLLINPFTALSQPITLSMVAERTGDFSNNTYLFSSNGGGFTLFFGSAGNAIRQNAGSFTSVTCSDSTPHAIQAIYNGASSAVDIDATPTTGLSVGSAGTTAGRTEVGADGGAAERVTGILCEFGIWPVAFTTGGGSNSANMSANQHAHWGF